MLNLFIRISFILISVGFAMPLLAQKTAIYTNEITDYNMGLELFEKQKYGAAQNKFFKVIESFNYMKSDIVELNSELMTNAQYYVALCALELFNRDAEFLLTRFIENYSESPEVKNAYFHLGKYKFRKKNYKRAIEWFQKVDVYNLNNEELSEYYFKIGYSYFVIAQEESSEDYYERARQMFYEIKDTHTKYSLPTVYYYSHISYLNKNYETALEGFLRLSEYQSFSNIIPYYITQIYYLQGKHEKLLEYAPPLSDTTFLKDSIAFS